MGNDFDLDVSFDDEEPDFSEISTADLQRAVGELPETLRAVARGLLLEKRTMSDVSQQLGIRQSELVSRRHRAFRAMARALNLQGEKPRR